MDQQVPDPQTELHPNETVSYSTPHRNVLPWLIAVVAVLGIGAGVVKIYLSQTVPERDNVILSPTLSPSFPTDAVQLPTTSVDKFAGWETYENIEKGYAIQYPPDVFTRMACPGEEFLLSVGSPNDSEPINMSTCARGNPYAFEITSYDTLEEPPHVSDEYYTVYSELITVGGVAAEKYTYTYTSQESSPGAKWFVIVHIDYAGKVYHIYFGAKDQLALFDQILSTFVFD